MKYEEFQELRCLNREQVLALAWGKLVEDPPGELSRPPSPPMLMIDRISDIERNGVRGAIRGERDVRLDDWFFQCHFVGDPVQPGCLGVDAIWQLVGLYATLCGARGTARALGCKEAEFAGQIRPHNKLVNYDVTIRRYSVSKATGNVMVIGSGLVSVDGEEIYSVRDAKVGFFPGIGYPDYPLRLKNSVGGVMKR